MNAQSSGALCRSSASTGECDCVYMCVCVCVHVCVCVCARVRTCAHVRDWAHASHSTESWLSSLSSLPDFTAPPSPPPTHTHTHMHARTCMQAFTGRTPWAGHVARACSVPLPHAPRPASRHPSTRAQDAAQITQLVASLVRLPSVACRHVRHRAHAVCGAQAARVAGCCSCTQGGEEAGVAGRGHACAAADGGGAGALAHAAAAREDAGCVGAGGCGKWPALRVIVCESMCWCVRLRVAADGGCDCAPACAAAACEEGGLCWSE